MKKNPRKKRHSSSLSPIFIAFFIVALVVVLVWLISLSGKNEDEKKETSPSVNVHFPSESDEDKEEDNDKNQNQDNNQEESSSQFIQAEFEDIDPMELGNDLVIDRIGNYTGIYMEDGTNDVVSRIMMLILKNESEKDLQYAEVLVEYTDFTATYKVTNLPVGESVVLLEQSRHKATSEKPLSASTKNVVFFNEDMSLKEDVFQISGMQGALNVKNISNSDVTGEIYIYYKNSAQDLYYGGITYRAKVDGGLKAGEIKQVMTGHYSPKGCSIVMVTSAE